MMDIAIQRMHTEITQIWDMVMKKGYTGNIVLTKYAENGKTVLEGAEFKLYKATKMK